MLAMYVHIVSYQAEIKWSLPPLCDGVCLGTTCLAVPMYC